MEEDKDLLKKYNQLYLQMILRYKDHIEDKENLNVAELPKLITPDDNDVMNIANRIKNALGTYSYGQNFINAAKLAYEYVKNEISVVSLPIEFWLRPSDTIKCSAGDVMDKATLLCSALIALGNVSSKVVTVVKPSERRFLVYCEFDGKIIALDLDRGFIQFEDRDKMLQSLTLNDGEDTTAYEFNDKMYNNLA
ncbi:MAG: hypothetical protein KGH49_01715 [Candidatus Micrarchaeota archaeon]|nr:hypothetical protein [Candidatus Micrarchaeota archaeon]